jgi:hypothetical protein
MRTLVNVMLCVVLLVTAATTPSAEEEQVTDATIDDLAWLGGYWMSDKRGVLMEECWLAPHGHIMLGLHRDYYDDGRSVFEYLRIVKTGDGIVYYASPGGYNTTKFELTRLSSDGTVKEAVFENPENEFPYLIRYTLDENGLMAAVEGIEDNVKIVKTWLWERAELPAPAASP